MLRGKRLVTPVQRSFIAAFATLPDWAQFYLAGGIALAEYYLGPEPLQWRTPAFPGT